MSWPIGCWMPLLASIGTHTCASKRYTPAPVSYPFPCPCSSCSHMQVSVALSFFHVLQKRMQSLNSSSACVLGRLMRALTASDPDAAVGMEKQLPPILAAEVRRERAVCGDALWGKGGRRRMHWACYARKWQATHCDARCLSWGWERCAHPYVWACIRKCV